MKPVFSIDLTDLKEYRDELDSMIKKYEQLNRNHEAKIKKLEDAGYNIDDMDKILTILFEE